ncbi:MAG TPA: CoB--CoM heterodisulfide reductase iron-sulfur subunit B family protein [Dissulfurispiraceae bacterium]|nr:CoB--CoM heterodisulfide reductase iron-sulfur subunit B family protein [Dissulfurispiraceae bacterium]
MEMAYYPGCSLHATSAFYDVQCRDVLSRLGVDLKEIKDWNCCGATSAAKTNGFLAVALPARNLGLADASGYKEMMIPCALCYSRTLLTQRALEGDKDLRDIINAELSEKVQGKIKLRSILDVLAAKVKSGELAAGAEKKLVGLKPACYYGCLQTRYPMDIDIGDSVENPQGMEKVCGALGAEAIQWGYKTDCCGASASLNDTDVSLRLMSNIVKDAVARGANCIVTACPMCQLNLDAYQPKVGERYGINERLPVFFITELVGISMGMRAAELQIDKHVIESIELLKGLNLL